MSILRYKLAGHNKAMSFCLLTFPLKTVGSVSGGYKETNQNAIYLRK